jgi:hypothetical protein
MVQLLIKRGFFSVINLIPKIWFKGLKFELDFKEFFGLMVYKSKEDIEKIFRLFEDSLGVSFTG